MCDVCREKAQSLRLLSQYGSARARAALEASALCTACRKDAAKGGLLQNSPLRQRPALAPQNLCAALQDLSRQCSIDCDVHWASTAPMPDPVRRDKTWQPVLFVEYVGSKVFSATFDVKRDCVCLTVRLFPLVSTGYVPFSAISAHDGGAYDGRQRSVVSWPAKHAPEWLHMQLPRIEFALDFAVNERCVLASADVAESPVSCSATIKVAPLTKPRCFLEYRVCIARDILAL